MEVGYRASIIVSCHMAPFDEDRITLIFYLCLIASFALGVVILLLDASYLCAYLWNFASGNSQCEEDYGFSHMFWSLVKLDII